MEVYFAATGPLHWLKLFENGLEAASFAIPHTLPNGQLMQTNMGGLLEPLQLYRFIVPKDAMPLVLRTLKVGTQSTAKNQIGNLPLFALRKVLGLKEIPLEPLGATAPYGPVLPVNTEHIQIVPIGIKEDAVGIIGPTGVFQEKI